jgi:hypothetical protein
MATTTSQPIAQASYNGGQALSAVGSDTYNASVALARSTPAPRVNPDSIGLPPSETNADGVNSGKPFGSGPGSYTPDDNPYSRLSSYAKGLTDSINAKYSADEANDKDLIAQNDARARALNNSSGNIDSGTGAAAVNNVQTKGNAKIAADEQAKQSSIATALGQVDTLRSNQEKADQAQARNDLTTANNLKVQNSKLADSTLQSLGKSNVDLNTLKTSEPESYNALLKESGLSPLELEAKYQTYKDTANQTKYQYKINGDTVTAYGVDSKGKLVVQDQVVPGLSAGNFQVVRGDNGVLYKVDKSSGAITPLVNAAKPLAEAKTKTGTTTTTQQKNEQNDALNWLALQPNYDKKDVEAFQNDPQFQAWAIEQAKNAKAARTKSTKTSTTAGA